MSVTFYGTDPAGVEITPLGWRQEFEQDPQYGLIMTNINPLSLNVSNDNFQRLMTVIGLEIDNYYGVFGDGSLQDLITRIEFALESLKAMPELDAGRPTGISRTERGMVMVECGTRDGYFTERLELLLQIAQAALVQDGSLQFN